MPAFRDRVKLAVVMCDFAMLWLGRRDAGGGDAQQ